MKLKNFFGNLKKEFNQVIWPTKEDVTKKTALVLVISFVLTLLILGLDTLYQYGLHDFLANL
ncbi:MAG: preprotein translocase subunit SecE [Clostridia bacterium]|nr:preprotein translocase subunit SecE [Clostridia bacterium]